MKKIRMILASAAVLLAVSGVIGSTLVATVYYRPSFANSDATSGEFCEEVVTTLCNDQGNDRCTQSETYSTPMGPVTKTVIISKIEVSDCEDVKRNN